jgi:hypothetical protein
MASREDAGREEVMDSFGLARAAQTLSHEAWETTATLNVLRAHSVGDGWRGPARRQAEVELSDTLSLIQEAISAVERAETEARRRWREAVAASQLSGG